MAPAFGEYLCDSLLRSSREYPRFPGWVEATGTTKSQKRYLHSTGACVLLDENRVTVNRGFGPDAFRAASWVEDWLQHVGCQWSVGTYRDCEVVYLAPDTSLERGR